MELHQNVPKCIDLSRSEKEVLKDASLTSMEFVRLRYVAIKDLNLLFSDKLRYLDISYTSVTSIPIDFCEFKNLERIDAYRMTLSFPDCFCGRSIRVINAELIDVNSKQNWSQCQSLLNASLYLPADSVESLEILETFSFMKSLTHLRLYNLTTKPPQSFKNNIGIKVLSVSIDRKGQVEELFNLISNWKNLRTLELIVPRNFSIPSSIAELDQLETLVVRTDDYGMVELPNEVSKLKLKRIFLFKNVRKLDMDKGICFLYSAGLNVNYYRKMNYCVEWLNDLIMIPPNNFEHPR